MAVGVVGMAGGNTGMGAAQPPPPAGRRRASFSFLGRGGGGGGRGGFTGGRGPAETDDGALEELLAPIKDDPGSSAVLTDIDGTIAPIVLKPADAAVPEPT